MGYYAHTNSQGVVVNMIVADTLAIATAVAPPGITALDVNNKPVGIGYAFDGTDWWAPVETAVEGVTTVTMTVVNSTTGVVGGTLSGLKKLL